MFPFLVNAQFSIEEYNRVDTIFMGELEADAYGTSTLFKVISEKESLAAAKISSAIYWDILDIDVHNARAFDSLLHLTSGSYSANFAYEIIENTDRFFTIEVSYGGSEEDDRVRHCYSFLSTTGEWLTFFDIFKADKIKEIEEVVFSDFQKEIDNLFAKCDSTHYHYSDLKRCAVHYFKDIGVTHDGDSYIDSDSVYFSFPFCPKVYHVFGFKHDWFQIAYSQEAFSGLLNERLIKYKQTGEWE